jgi:hypothetical protein
MSTKIKIINYTFISLLITCNVLTKATSIIERDTVYNVELKVFYDGEGIIFPKEGYDFRFGNYKRVDLTKSDVIKAEEILDSVTNIKLKCDTLKLNEIKTKRRKYNRQYWGIKIDNNDRIVIIFIFNFGNPQAVRYFNKDWEKGYFFSTDNVYSENTRIYLINLTKERMEDGSWSLEL